MTLEPSGFYEMVIRSIREMDEKAPGRKILKGICEQVLDPLWEAGVVAPAASLPTLRDVNLVDAKWVRYFGPMLGFTDDKWIPADNEDQLRRLLRDAIPFWSARPAEEGVIDIAVRMVCSNLFRVANFFDLRMQVDQSALVEGVPGRDPYVLGFFAGERVEGSVANAGGYVAIDLYDLPADKSLLTGEYAFIQITSGGSPTNVGVYRIKEPVSRTTATIYESLPDPSASGMSWVLWGWMDEYLTCLRVVDPAGGGDLAIPTAILRFLLNEGRPSGERIDVAYTWFLDQFLDGLEQWTTSGTVTSSVEDGMVVETSGFAITNDADISLWTDQVVCFRVHMVSEAPIFQLAFRATAYTDKYTVAINCTARTLKFFTYVSGSPAQLGATVNLPSNSFSQDLWEHVRVVAVDNSTGGVLLQAWVNGDLLLEYEEATKTQSYGGPSIGCSSGAVGCNLVEVAPFPMKVERVGPNP